MAFNMKGSPMHRNFGIGSPAKQSNERAEQNAQFENLPESEMKRITRIYMQGGTLTEADQKIMDDYVKSQSTGKGSSSKSDSTTTTKPGPPQHSKFKNHGVDAGASTSGAGPVKPGSNAIQ